MGHEATGATRASSSRQRRASGSGRKRGARRTCAWPYGGACPGLFTIQPNHLNRVVSWAVLRIRLGEARFSPQTQQCSLLVLSGSRERMEYWKPTSVIKSFHHSLETVQAFYARCLEISNSLIWLLVSARIRIHFPLNKGATSWGRYKPQNREANRHFWCGFPQKINDAASTRAPTARSFRRAGGGSHAAPLAWIELAMGLATWLGAPQGNFMSNASLLSQWRGGRAGS